MYNTFKINEDLTYIGGSDRRIALFENAYPVPDGVSYNSYFLDDEKTEKVMNLIDALNDIDDVSDVYHNLDV